MECGAQVAGVNGVDSATHALTEAALRERAVADTEPTRLLRTFKFRLLPRKAQHVRLRAALDHSRELYNAALEERIAAYRLKGEARSYMAQSNALTELRTDDAWAVFPVAMQRWPLKKLDHAFQAFFRRLKSGEKPGFPRFRGRERFNSFGFSDLGGWAVKDGRLHMKGVGRVRLHLHRSLPSKPLSCQVKRDAKGWCALLVCEVEAETLAATGQSVGLDLGVTSFAALSTGETVPGLKASRRARAKARRRQRALARCKRGSRSRCKAKSRIARLHLHTANARRTHQHQLAARLVRENDLIAIENLNVKGLARGMLAQDVHDAGWASFTTLLSEKAERAGRTLVKVDPRHTSQTCPGCGSIRPKTLAQRAHRCDCGCVLDRDVAAAQVILHRAVVGPRVDKQRVAAA